MTKTILESPDQLAAALDELAESPKLDRHKALAAKQGASVIREQHLALEAACQMEQASEPTGRQTFTVPDGAEPVLDAEGRATGELTTTPTHEADAVRVKPLEWQRITQKSIAEIAQSILGNYYVDDSAWSDATGVVYGCTDRAAAKAAAQADYERRIRSALLPAPAPAAREPGTGVSGEVVHLTFDDLRRANIARQEHWGGSENWTLADWSNAVAGEVGEACNVVKKIRRPQLRTIGNGSDVAAYYSQLESEIGDVLIYLDLLAKAAGLGLAGCVIRAFNDKSAKLDMPVRLAPALSASHRAHPGREEIRNEALEEAAAKMDALADGGERAADAIIREWVSPENSREDNIANSRTANEHREAARVFRGAAAAIRSLKSPPHSAPPTSSKGA